MLKEIKDKKAETYQLRSTLGKKGAQSFWGDTPRPKLARISVEADLGPVVSSLPLADRVRVTSEALRIGLSSIGVLKIN